MQFARRISAAVLMLAVLSTTMAFSAPAFAAGITLNKEVTITNTGGDNIRIREGAGASYDVKASMAEGDKVWVLEGPVKADGHNWYRVSFGSRVGWVDSRFLSGGSTAASAGSTTKTNASAAKPVVATIAAGGYAKVANTNGDSLRVRATVGGKVVATLAPGAVLSVTKGPSADKAGTKWYLVSGSGVSGWVMSSYLVKSAAPVVAKASAKTSTATSAARSGTARGATSPSTAIVATNASAGGIVATAMKYVGSPYRYAGTTPAGFDCSGFVYYIFNKAGVPLSRSMSVQIAAGTKISSSQLQPGDLVYFSNTYKKGISHIAIYIGNGKIVHAADYGIGVTVSDLWSPYWIAHYTGAVRIRG